MKLFIADNSVDSLITDPPAGIAFMGKEWDKDKGGRDGWIKWMSGVMEECYRVMKPGAHGFVWALPRTSHWTATACENAGFEIRDVVMHVFGSGFPKSHNVSKGIDKAAGAEPVKIGERKVTSGGKTFHGEPYKLGEMLPVTTPATPEAKQWDGWGTALKPAAEHWVLIRKPLEKGMTVAKNVLEHGTGGINIDASRIEFQSESDKAEAKPKGRVHSDRANHPGWDTEKQNLKDAPDPNPQGRFPANFICSGEARDVLDEQSGKCRSSGHVNMSTSKQANGNTGIHFCSKKGFAKPGVNTYSDSGEASRFFYCAKASKAERNAGCEGEAKATHRFGAGIGEGKDPNAPSFDKNHHPTVKAQKLMRYLVKMITPPHGTILDPFTGSGSTGVAAESLGFEFIGIEQDAEYLKIAEARITNASKRSNE